MKTKEFIDEILSESVSKDTFQMGIIAAILPLPSYITLWTALGRQPNAEEIFCILIPTMFLCIGNRLIQKLSNKIWNRFL